VNTVEPDRGTLAHAVELVSVSKYYGSLAALDDISLQIQQGEFYTLLGPSGCGKTTTLNIIGGFIPISKGQLYINGKLVQNDPPYRRNVNTVFQNYALFPHMTVAQNIGFGPRMKKVPQAEIDRRVEEMLALISLPGFGERRPAQLSGGQQQRIALARALINEPAVLLLDEPLGALDLKIRKQLQVELRNIQRKVGITFVYVTHDQEEAMVLSDRIAVMNKGQVIQEDTATMIYHHPANRFVANFIGESNFLPGKVRGAGAGQVLTDIPGFARPVRTLSGKPVENGAAVTVMVRPERIAWHLGPGSVVSDDLPDLDNAAEGVIVKTAFLGMYTQIGVELADGTTVLIHQPGEGETDSVSQSLVGQRITIGWKIRDGQLLTD
jgi:spermidine/putrescine transport system ATP-binding protein